MKNRLRIWIFAQFFIYFLFCFGRNIYGLENQKIKSIYLSSDESAVLYDTTKNKKLVLISDNKKLFDIYEVSSDKRWAIISNKAKFVGPGRVEEIMELYFIPKKLIVPRKQIFEEVPFGFEKENSKEFLVTDSDLKILLDDLEIRIE